MKKDKVADSTEPDFRKIFGSRLLQTSESEASRLVGGIVEKGFPDESQSKPRYPSSVPRPSVLPFPIARHRSHGPHWVPNSTELFSTGSSGNDDIEVAGEDEDLMNFDPIAALANPVPKKDKKALDFSNWKELSTNDDSSTLYRKGKQNIIVKSKQQRKICEATGIPEVLRKNSSVEHCGPSWKSPNSEATNLDVKIDDVDVTTLRGVEARGQYVSSMDIEGQESDSINVTRKSCEGVIEETNDFAREMIADRGHRCMSAINASYTSSGTGNEHGSLSLASQIDAENRARLKCMSTDEIAKTKAEIMSKLSPALRKMLKKRGDDKANRQKHSNLNLAYRTMGSLQDQRSLADASDITVPQKGEKGDCKGSYRVYNNNKEVKGEYNLSSRLWNAWSRRVEAVREYRFLLDGDVVGNFFSQAPDIGKVYAYSGYGASNVSERDFLRTDGDPGGAGYTIEEAVTLTRSVVPGQRVLALHLILSVLSKALHNIRQTPAGCTLEYQDSEDSVDWVAVWAFALGPEPELSLSLRMSLDDNHNSVVLASTKVIQCILCCDINESFFTISEKVGFCRDLCTAPVFRSRPDIDVGFLHGGFWKYNTKPVNIVLTEVEQQEKPEDERTIQDDVVVAGQDVAAGLIRMGILPRIRYILESNPSAALEEGLISILIAISRHSPICAGEIMMCERLIITLVNRFTMIEQTQITMSKIKCVSLFKVLARSNKKNCIDFINNGIFQKMTWHLYQYAFSPCHWHKLEREHFKLSSALVVEQLRFWKACIDYGYCVSYFSDLFPALCNWLDVPDFKKLVEKNILNEFAAISKEAYLVMEALSRRLPNFYSNIHHSNLPEVDPEGEDSWCWSHVGPVIDLALRWTSLSYNPYLSKFISEDTGNEGNPKALSSSLCSILWVMSSIFHMLSGVLKRVTPEDVPGPFGSHVLWLPEFVPKIGIEIIKNRFVSFIGVNDKEYGKFPVAAGYTFTSYMCHLRNLSEHELSIASVCCLNGLFQVIISVDKLIKLANFETIPFPQLDCCLTDGKVLYDGILMASMVEWGMVQAFFLKLIASEQKHLQSIEVFGRGGPAPGLGVGWGATGGGFWSTTTLLTQMDARLLVNLLEIFPSASAKDLPEAEDMNFMLGLNSSLEVCLLAGPGDKFLFDKALDILLQVPVLKYLNLCIHRFLHHNEGFKHIDWEYKEEDYLHFCHVLASHFRNRWLCVKKKLKGNVERGHNYKNTVQSSSSQLNTIFEDLDEVSVEHFPSSLTLEWAHQRLPLPEHWFLSPISTINHIKHFDVLTVPRMPDCVPDPTNFLEVAKGGLFFILGLEILSSFISSEFHSFIQCVPVAWKLHSLSVVLLRGMGVLEDKKSRDICATLQDVYGQLLDKSRLLKNGGTHGVDFMQFQSEIHESYTTFIEMLVEQFSAVSYGDLIYGRQVAIYLHRCVEGPVRLAAWNALSNARVLELLPSLNKCVAKAEGYLLPVEEDEKILEAYVKSWTSGALDRAATRNSMSFKLVQHHLSSFIFGNCGAHNILLRNRLVKALLRGYSSKKLHEAMVMDFIRYKPAVCKRSRPAQVLPLQMYELEERFNIIREACDGNSSLLDVVKKIELSFTT